MNEGDVIELFRTCSNEGRWGPDDELGTVNLVTPDVRRRALALARVGTVVSLGRDLRTRDSRQRPPSAVHVMSYMAHEPVGSADYLGIMVHGFEVTHLDAVGHAYYGGAMYNGRKAGDMVTPEGLGFASIQVYRDGIVTRGVLLDVAEVRGVPYLAADDGVTVADLEHAEQASGTNVGPGDAVFVRTGHDRRIAVEGWHGEDVREGVLPEVIPWLRERDVAVWSGDCIERLPSGLPGVPLPLHQVGMSAMGLAFLDMPDVEVLRDACRAHGTSEFLLVIAPLRIPGGTGSPVNPLAIF